MEVRTSADQLLIFDAGTGIRPLGNALLNGGGHEIQADVYLTHAHWDHIQGIPFFSPLFAAGNRFRFWSSRTLEAGLDRVVRDQMAPVVFPVPFDQLGAQVEFCEVEEGVRYGTGYELTAMQVRHPGGALGYKMSDGDGGRTLVYISDNELGPGGEYPQGAGWRNDLVKWIRGSQMLVHDATYTANEYEAHRGWGHSTNEQAVDLALETGVETLVLYHHSPDRGDAEVDRIVEQSTEYAAGRGGKLRVIAAAEGLELIV